ncbi:Beta-1,3-galactosyltransferase brn [Mizuhopecten yessoensis]|uniref:Hexosyltransferase n=1 Tax=Mizuhopecten yessoensis TaxID=6573 RepID=A0A210QYH5_MIZYE|nr:Beta-1,3-galactosyltransferase brn [Mizuhopecten yessoensis]
MAPNNDRIWKSLLLMIFVSTGLFMWNAHRQRVGKTLQTIPSDLARLSTQAIKVINTTDHNPSRPSTGHWKGRNADLPNSNISLSNVSFDRSVTTLKRESLNHPRESWKRFPYPLDTDMVELVRKLRSNMAVKESPIFQYQYKFSYHPVHNCMEGSLLFIFLIKSAAGHFERRKAIRETWASSELMTKHNFIRMFLVGSPEKQLEMSDLRDEHEHHRDLIIMSFRENYYNNTLKTIGAIHWTVQHCNRSKFVVFVDDDMLIFTTRLVDFLKFNATLPNFFGGAIQLHKPQRFRKSKWYVSPQDYPHDTYPPMPSAAFMIMTMNFVIDLHFASQYTKKFIYDDCYLGILAYKLRVTPVSIHSVKIGLLSKKSIVFKYEARSLLAAHGYSPSLLRITWRIL